MKGPTKKKPALSGRTSQGWSSHSSSAMATHPAATAAAPQARPLTGAAQRSFQPAASQTQGRSMGTRRIWGDGP